MLEKISNNRVFIGNHSLSWERLISYALDQKKDFAEIRTPLAFIIDSSHQAINVLAQILVNKSDAILIGRDRISQPVKDLLLGVIVQSGNDAAIALAEGISGTEEGFAEEMNYVAKVDFTNRATMFKNDALIKYGLFASYKEREYDIFRTQVNVPTNMGTLNNGDANNIFKDGNIWTVNNTGGNSIDLLFNLVSRGKNFDADQTNLAGYISFEL